MFVRVHSFNVNTLRRYKRGKLGLGLTEPSEKNTTVGFFFYRRISKTALAETAVTVYDQKLTANVRKPCRYQGTRLLP